MKKRIIVLDKGVTGKDLLTGGCCPSSSQRA
jgi:hypothetical protein